MTEEWRGIPGYEGWYQVSRMGSIRSRDRFIPTRAGYGRWHRGIVLRSKTKPNGYQFVCLSKNAKRQYPHIHQLVALAFIGPCPDGYQINHRDGDKTNNRVENLEWCSPKENMKHARNVLGVDNRGSNSSVAILHEDDIPEIRNLLAQGLTHSSIAERYGVSRETITRIREGSNWAHVK